MLVDVNIRPARPDEAAEVSDLAIRSKGHWGYSAAFLDACRDELTVRPEQCDGVHLFVAEHSGNVVGFVRLDGEPPAAELADLFVDPAAIGSGVGRRLLECAIEQARRLAIERLMIEADPNAESFYLRAGAVTIGDVPSGSVIGRRLPLLELAIPSG